MEQQQWSVVLKLDFTQFINMTQAEKILNVLEKNRGNWISGSYFLRNLYLSQFHTRIFELEKKGYPIEHSDFKDEWGFVSYRLPLLEPTQQKLI